VNKETWGKSAKRKIKRTLLKKREKRWTEARKPRDPESPKGFPGGLTQRP